ncbi:octopine/nopaline transport system substrate-binding protein [Azospirillum fermentarium]|uniref:transporter substrate-binding domain-containing protein n=1 Tax=Azospirillum fermentarium TaxID=1233114 RepID=UPI002225E325|nr:transporter substrate-binding domain-containing protein [Azospirillum fermentarium]MCW2244743.1 octopine/nopaline transport system substrate-binding protein [Azospirillum fermentarium]
MSMKMIAAVALAVGILSLSTVAGTTPTPQPLRIVTEGAYAPWNATGSGGELVGFEVDLARDLCRRMAVECQMVGLEWEGLIPALRQGRADAVMAAVSITEERRGVIGFAGPYAAEPSAFAVRDGVSVGPGLPTHLDLSDNGTGTRKALAALAALLEGRTVGVQPGSTQALFLAQRLPDVRVVDYPTIEAAAFDLVAGRIDAVFGARSAVGAVTCGHDGVIPLPMDVAGGEFGQGVGVGLRKGDTALQARFDDAIRAAVADGTVSRLSARWFGFDLAAVSRP